MIMNKIPFLLAAFGCLSSAFAQTDTLIQRDILLEKNYVPIVETAGKIHTAPEREEMQTNKTEISYATGDYQIKPDAEYVALSPAGIQTDFPDQERKGYLRIGGGNHWSFLGDGQYNLLRDPKQTLDFNLMHRSQAAPASGETPWDSHNLIQANWKRHQGYSVINASLSESFDRWSYYGTATAPGSLPEHQWSSDTRLQAGISSKPWDKAIDYQVGIDGHLYKLGKLPTLTTVEKGIFEEDLLIDGMVAWHIDDAWTAAFDTKIRLLGYQHNDLISSTLDIYSDLPAANPANQVWWEIHPNARYAWRGWAFAAGLKLSQVSGEGLRAAATASAARDLGDHATVLLQVDGGQQVRSYREGFLMNPYLNPETRLQPEYTPVHISGRLSWKPVETLELSPVAGWRSVNGMPLFFNADTLQNNFKTFSAAYVKTSHLYAGVDLDWVFRQYVRLSADFRYNRYSAYKKQDDALTAKLTSIDRNRLWYKPAFESDLMLEINPVEYLSLSAQYHWEGKRFAPTGNEKLESIGDIHFFALEGSYRLTDRIGVFIQARNILNQSYQTWSDYPNLKLTILAGASYSF